MARNAGFWGWYAQANDSARSELIDKGWFGQNHAETPMQDALIEQEEPQHEIEQEQEP